MKRPFRNAVTSLAVGILLSTAATADAKARIRDTNIPGLTGIVDDGPMGMSSGPSSKTVKEKMKIAGQVALEHAIRVPTPITIITAPLTHAEDLGSCDTIVNLPKECPKFEMPHDVGIHCGGGGHLNYR